jgi:hypothetical protein
MTAPTIDPDHRDPDDVAPTDTYRPMDPVWVHRGGVWCAGVVESASKVAATVTYRPTASVGTGVDTLTARYVVPRFDLDPVLDRSPVQGPTRSVTKIRPVLPIRTAARGQNPGGQPQHHPYGQPADRPAAVLGLPAPTLERLASAVERITGGADRLGQPREEIPRAG